ncbi:major facilitator superfamily domain-containing protein [Infundibulicybe gibba]|nr:major facilitator superfamily domain-containing protein [Infundibulicybe gibba]
MRLDTPNIHSSPSVQSSIMEPLSPNKNDADAPVTSTQAQSDLTRTVHYKLYKQRFAGLSAWLGFPIPSVLLNIVSAMSWPWFGPISNNMVDEFGITLDQVNWLGNIVACVYLPTAILIPTIVSKYGIRRCCDIGAVALVFSAWIRYAGTSRSLSSGGAYALLFLGQLFAAIAQPIYQVLGPRYSETWFDLEGRTTATMIVAISNPVGGALGQLLSPLVGDTRNSILILGIMSTVVIPAVFLIQDTPPSPPTYAGSKQSPPSISVLRAMLGMNVPQESHMSNRERVDFGIVILIFGVLVAATNSFAILTAQYMQPVGYSADVSGLMGACLLLTGIIAAIITAPLFDRVFTHHLAITSKFLVPILAGTWLSLIWAVKPNNLAGLFVIMTILGVCSITMLPIGLELGCELTRNADVSSAILWFAGNLFGVIFILAEGALRAGPSAHPPLNMRRALIFNGAFVSGAAALVFLLRGKQVRKERDEGRLSQPIAP